MAARHVWYARPSGCSGRGLYVTSRRAATPRVVAAGCRQPRLRIICPSRYDLDPLAIANPGDPAHEAQRTRSGTIPGCHSTTDG